MDSSNVRGGGFISLENMIFFAKTYPVCISLLRDDVLFPVFSLLVYLVFYFSVNYRSFDDCAIHIQ